MTSIKALFGCCLFILFLGCNKEIQLDQEDPYGVNIVVPEGFEVISVIESIGPARHLTIAENGDIYVKLRSSDTLSGGNVALRDTNFDGRADIAAQFGGAPNEGNIYGAGMVIHNGYLYFGSATKVYRYRLTPGKLVPESPREIVLDDDHPHGEHWHITKPVSFDNKGFMYIPFGAPSNACQDILATPNGASGGVGLDPCPELEQHGGIWKFDASKTGLKQSDGVRIATGIRSVVAMDWNSEDEHLYIVMHGRDNLYSLYPDRFTPWQSAVLPSEEFIRIEAGADYGWPYCFYDQVQGKKVLAPEYGGNGVITARCDSMDLPIIGFPGHWAPNDLMFYHGDQFPERYKNGAFIAFHGSTNRAPYPQAGYFVGFVPFKDGKPSHTWEVFADGFAGVDTIFKTRDAIYRPMGLAEGPDGSLYICDSNKGKIWRIQFKGDKASFGINQLAQMEERKNRTNIRTPDVINDDLQQHLSAGEKLYNTFCGTCHQKDGEGVPGRFPPLTNTPWVTGDKNLLIEVTLKGMQGPIEVKGASYNAVMPPHNFLTDEDITTILNFVRKNFGNGATAINPADVNAVRETLFNE